MGADMKEKKEGHLSGKSGPGGEWMKKIAVIAAVLSGAIALFGGTVYAAGELAHSNAITEEEARNFACVDAGILPEEAGRVQTEFDYEDGIFVYEIEFTANGRILERESKAKPVTAPKNGYAATPAKSREDAAKTSPHKQEGRTSDTIGMDRAKEIALEKAGLSEENVTVKKARPEHEDGRLVYDIEFYIVGQTEYEYEIDAYTGAVLDEDIERWDD